MSESVKVQREVQSEQLCLEIRKSRIRMKYLVSQKRRQIKAAKTVTVKNFLLEEDILHG